MFDTTTPGGTEKLSDQRAKGKLALLLIELCTKVRLNAYNCFECVHEKLHYE